MAKPPGLCYVALSNINAGVMELVDMTGLEPVAQKAWGFESLHPYLEKQMAGKHDVAIRKLAKTGKGGQLIAQALDLNQGYVGRRLKALGLTSTRKNQYSVNENTLNVVFKLQKDRIASAAEHYLRFICDLAGYYYADPPAYEPYDLLVDFGDGWAKVQVKSAEGETFALCRSRVNSKGTRRSLYSSDEVDWFFLFGCGLRCWLVPFSELEGKATIRAAKMLPGFEVAYPS